MCPLPRAGNCPSPHCVTTREFTREEEIPASNFKMHASSGHHNLVVFYTPHLIYLKKLSYFAKPELEVGVTGPKQYSIVSRFQLSAHHQPFYR
jgi:hypothetical protein